MCPLVKPQLTVFSRQLTKRHFAQTLATQLLVSPHANVVERGCPPPRSQRLAAPTVQAPPQGVLSPFYGRDSFQFRCDAVSTSSSSGHGSHLPLPLRRESPSSGDPITSMLEYIWRSKPRPRRRKPRAWLHPRKRRRPCLSISALRTRPLC